MNAEPEQRSGREAERLLGVEIICTPPVSSGFRLAGHHVLTALPESAVADLEELLADEELGVLLVEQSLFDALPEDLQRSVGTTPLPLVLPFPGPRWEEGEGEQDRYIAEMLRQAVGYRLRLR